MTLPPLAVADSIQRCTDVGNGRRFWQLWCGIVRYCYEDGRWIVWDGMRYAPDISGQVATYAKRTASTIFAEAAGCADSSLQKELARWAIATESEHHLAAMQSCARSEPGIPVRLDELDRNTEVLNVLNGILDLREGSLRPHSQAELCTKLASVAFDPHATCPTFQAFLARVLPDPAIRSYIQKVVGYCLTGSTIEQVLIFFHGSGANGKSVFLELLFRLLGDYAVRADSSALMVRRADGPRNDLADMVGSRLVVASEANEGARLDESVVKQLSGGDRITARRLYSNNFTFRPTFKVILAANSKPTISSRGHAIWRRMRVVPFVVTIPESERDPHLLEKLTAELSGVLTWAVEGAVLWHLYGLGDAPAVTEATATYRAEMDTLAPFLEEQCALGVEHQVAAGELFEAYVEWAGRNQERPISKHLFGVRLSEHGIGERKGKAGKRFRTGIRLRVDGQVAQVAEGSAPPVLLPHREELEIDSENGLRCATHATKRVA